MNTASAAILLICTAGAALVFGAMLYSIVKFPHTNAGGTSRNLKECAWALVPIIIVIAAAIPALQKHADGSATQLVHRATGDSVGVASIAAHSELEVRTAAAHR